MIAVSASQSPPHPNPPPRGGRELRACLASSLVPTLRVHSEVNRQTGDAERRRRHSHGGPWERVLHFLLLSLATLAPASAQAADPSKPPVDFNREIRPILAKNCFACHGLDEAHRGGKLRLDVRGEAVRELPSGAVAIVPGKASESELVSRLNEADESARMPPAKEGERLKPSEVALITRWIDEGASYAEHWALVKPKDRTLPEVADKAWPRNGIDHWVAHRLAKAGLKPSREADRFALLRRASLDLRGLPPTLKEIDDFAADTSADAYEKAVDKMLADPAYGERWARVWLDLARYADSAGYGSDPLRTIWRYRDWVIDAYNKNQPFDQFTVEQLAGDLLPNATTEQKIATAFHRNTMTNTEGGTDDEEFRVAAIKDRVDSTWQIWLGLTMGCAKCHNHKYDPITQNEYYSFYAFFNQTADADRPDESPILSAPTPEQIEQSRKIDEQVAALKTILDTPTPELAADQAAWEAELSGPSEWTTLDLGSAGFEKQPDGSLKAVAPNEANRVDVLKTKLDTRGITAIRLEAIPDPSLPSGGSGRGPNGNFTLTKFSVEAGPADNSQTKPTARFVRVELPGNEKILSLAEVEVFQSAENLSRTGEASQSSTGYEGVAARAIDGKTDGNYYGANSTTHTAIEANPWWELKLKSAQPIDRVQIWNRTDGGVGERLSNFVVKLLDDNRKVVWQSEVAKPPAPSVELQPSGIRNLPFAGAYADHEQPGFPIAGAIAAKGNPNKGWSIGDKPAEPHSAVFLLKEPLDSPTPVQLTIRLEQNATQPYLTLGRFRIAVTSDPKAAKRVALPPAILALLNTPATKRSQSDAEALAKHYRSIAPRLKPRRDEIAKLEASRPAAPTVPVMEELPEAQRRKTTVLQKGNFLTPGEAVEPGVPSVLPKFPEGAKADRLGMARWILDPENPLTARVAVNRYWAQIFGAGLVETEEDFGTQGEPPSDPELLDWLAIQYRKLGWDTKAFLRMILTSSTYRQTSKVTPELLEKDPKNRLMSRGPRFRLEAEMVRDQALALSGLLSRKMHGPSVFPPQPDGLWQAAFNGQRTWATSPGEDGHRRGVYTFWRRTVPYPSMATFDAPSREICAVRRMRTNTPLQAFVTLNDPVYVEASQALARRIVAEGGSSVEDRVKFGLKLCLGRPPADEQVKSLAALYQTERDHYAGDPKAALELATNPLGPLPKGLDPADLAAWTTIANILLNLDAVLTKG